MIHENGFVVEFKVDGETIVMDINALIIDSMKDIKYKTKLSGLGGADCLLCSTKQEQWLSVPCIANGFPINRSANQNMQLWLALAIDGEVAKESGDFETRKGLTQMPMTISDQRSITITHSYINGTHWFCKFLPRVMTNVKKWSLKSTSRQAILVDYKKDVMLDKIKAVTGVTLEKLNKGGRSGTTTTGNSGRIFFSSKLVPVIQELIPESTVQEKILQLHKKMSILLRIISSDKTVDITAYKTLVSDIEQLLAVHFSWARLNFTLHATLQHSAELIQENDDRGLGTLSEEALESNNKDLRRFMETLSRKFSGELQLTDVIIRALERSNPLIQERIRSFKKPLLCTLCHSTDHTSRKCPQKEDSPANASIDAYDILFNSIATDDYDSAEPE